MELTPIKLPDIFIITLQIKSDKILEIGDSRFKENSNKIMIASHTSIRGANSNWSNPNKVAILILVILVLLFTSFIRIV